MREKESSVEAPQEKRGIGRTDNEEARTKEGEGTKSYSMKTSEQCFNDLNNTRTHKHCFYVIYVNAHKHVHTHIYI